MLPLQSEKNPSEKNFNILFVCNFVKITVQWKQYTHCIYKQFVFFISFLYLFVIDEKKRYYFILSVTHENVNTCNPKRNVTILG